MYYTAVNTPLQVPQYSFMLNLGRNVLKYVGLVMDYSEGTFCRIPKSPNPFDDNLETTYLLIPADKLDDIFQLTEDEAFYLEEIKKTHLFIVKHERILRKLNKRLGTLNIQYIGY